MYIWTFSFFSLRRKNYKYTEADITDTCMQFIQIHFYVCASCSKLVIVYMCLVYPPDFIEIMLILVNGVISLNVYNLEFQHISLFKHKNIPRAHKLNKL